ncbi:MAG TPA: sulfite exporter TauE/SafE family protein, partial [Coxiellaceae bacterium]|nr:sulfite exporter TauE/SafE family protein [Coxiellaceae bacterium]
TSLAIMLFTTASAAYWHYKSGHLKLDLLWKFLPGLILGVIWGWMIAHQLSSANLELIFSLLMLFIAYRLWFKKVKASGPKPGGLKTAFMSFAIGGIAGLLGVGGGILSVPYLLRYKISTSQAVALGVLFSFIVAVVGTLCWWLLSHPVALAHEGVSLSYINWPAVLIAGCAGVLIAPWGAKLSKHLSESHLRRGLAVLLVLLFLQKFISWFLVVIQ